MLVRSSSSRIRTDRGAVTDGVRARVDQLEPHDLAVRLQLGAPHRRDRVDELKTAARGAVERTWLELGQRLRSVGHLDSDARRSLRAHGEAHIGEAVHHRVGDEFAHQQAHVAAEVVGCPWSQELVDP